MIIGLSGTLLSGKDEFANHLKSKGFEYLSLSDVIREEVRRRGLEPNRENLQDTGNELRRKNGSSILADLTIKKLIPGNNYAIVSIRNPEEVRALRKIPGFTLVFVDAPVEERYKRMKARKREGEEVISFEKFVEQEERELRTNDPAAQQLLVCKELSDFTIMNDSTLADFHFKIDKVLRSVNMSSTTDTTLRKYVRPSWDEYFMEVAKTIGKRATCDRGRMGCVIARDKQILVTGYVGSPKGFEHCDEVGHLLKKVIHDDGTISQHCMRTVHGEQNAICQAAKLGIGIDGATLYTTLTPCMTCAMLLINCGIKRVVCQKKYHRGRESEEMLRKAGVEMVFIEEEVESYPNQ